MSNWRSASFLAPARRLYKRWLTLREGMKNRRRSAEEVFTEVYKRNMWGGSSGELCSGDGSTDAEVVDAYVSTVTRMAEREGFMGARFVDLGCGDFRVGKRLVDLSSSYVGVDVVPDVIASNSARFASTNVTFLHADICEDELPTGDVCFVRQVLQHLSNRQIAKVLAKLKRFKWVVITEHQPTDSPKLRHNLDKFHGSGTRLEAGSGVYLSSPPFNLPEEALELVLEATPASVGSEDPGVIRTFLYKPATPRRAEACESRS